MLEAVVAVSVDWQQQGQQQRQQEVEHHLQEVEHHLTNKISE
jgi:hypothetical protein